MFDSKFLVSVLWKFVYVVVAAAALAIANWTQANPDIGLWTIDSLKIAVAAAVVAAVKKFITGFFVSP